MPNHSQTHSPIPVPFALAPCTRSSPLCPRHHTACRRKGKVCCPSGRPHLLAIGRPIICPSLSDLFPQLTPRAVKRLFHSTYNSGCNPPPLSAPDLCTYGTTIRLLMLSYTMSWTGASPTLLTWKADWLGLCQTSSAEPLSRCPF